ncbi:unnamed protein product [Camellia sinensis]
MSSLLVYVFICLSFHACDARHLGFTHKQTSHGFHISSKDVEEEKHQENLIPSSVGPYISKAMGTREKIVGKKDETGIHEKWDGAKEDLTKGNEITSSSSQAVLQEPTKIVEWKRQARWMLSSTSQNAEETVDHSKEDDPVEDIVVMDYAQPHRKPPIHN